jgi:hypothetical protein
MSEFPMVQDVAIPKPGHLIFCGSGTYKWAVVVSVEPFVLVSQHGDMCWKKQDMENFVFIKVPLSKACIKGISKRWRREQEDNDDG